MMDEILDIRTLSFINGIISVLITMVMLYVVATNKTYPGFRIWSAAFVFSAVGIILISLRGFIPEFFSVILANLAITTCFILWDKGVSRFTNSKETASAIYALILLIQAVFFFYFTYYTPSVLMRIIVVSTVFAIVLSHFLYLLIRNMKNVLHTFPLLQVIAAGLLAFWFAKRALLTAIMNPSISDFMFSGSYHGLTFVINITGAVLTALGFILLNHQRIESDLTASVNTVNTLKTMIPICASCKKVRDDSGYWNQVEVYVKTLSDVNFSHSICPDCIKKLYPEISLTEELKRNI